MERPTGRLAPNLRYSSGVRKREIRLQQGVGSAGVYQNHLYDLSDCDRNCDRVHCNQIGVKLMAPKKKTETTPSVKPITSAPVSNSPPPPPSTKPGVDVAGLDELTYQFNLEGLKRQERAHNLRGQSAKVEQSKLAADKEELKVERRQLEYQIEEQKVLKTRDDLKGHTANRALNQVDWVKKLSQKAYGVSGDVSYLQKAQSAIKSAPLQSLAGSVDGSDKE